MKKVFMIIICALTVLLTISVVGFVLIKVGIIDFNKIKPPSVYVYEDGFGRIYTERDWDWKPIKSKDILEYTNSNSMEKQTVTLSLDKGIFYDLKLPMGNYIYDYGKTIYAEDGSYLIRVVANSTLDNLSEIAGLDNGVNLDKVTLHSQDDTKGMKIICTLIDNHAIIANVYSGNENYSIIRDALLNKETYSISGMEKSEDFKELDKISYSGKYVAQVVFQSIDLSWNKYLFEDGELITSVSYLPMKPTFDEYITKIMAFSRSPVSELYQSKSMCYAKAGEYELGLLKYNDNTTIVLLGYGEEAKCNIVSIMQYLK